MVGRLVQNDVTLAKLTREVAKLTPGHVGHVFQAGYLALLTQAVIEEISLRLNHSDLISGSDPESRA